MEIVDNIIIGSHFFWQYFLQIGQYFSCNFNINIKY